MTCVTKELIKLSERIELRLPSPITIPLYGRNRHLDVIGTFEGAYAQPYGGLRVTEFGDEFTKISRIEE